MGNEIGRTAASIPSRLPSSKAIAAGATLLEVLDRRIPTAARRWLSRGTRPGGASFDAEDFLLSFADAGTWLGAERLELTSEEYDRLRDAGLTWPLGGWTLDDLGRVVLLVLVAPHLPEARHREFLDAVWDRAMIDERRALLRALPLLPKAHRFLDLALAGADSAIPELFEAIALDNPLPAAAFPDADLEKLVLKALYLGASVDRIQGLSSRVTPALSRTLEGYARARGLGGSPLPRGISKLLAGGRAIRTVGSPVSAAPVAEGAVGLAGPLVRPAGHPAPAARSLARRVG